MEIRILEYRGHIRNWKKLCEELGIPQDLSRSEREREIILNGYKKWGTDIGNHIYGSFAFVLKDNEKTVAVRDQFGTKTLYYYLTDEGELLCGSYIRKIISQPGFRKELNKETLQNYLTLTYAGGEDTFFKGMKKLMPGHCLVYENGKLEILTYWEPEFHPDNSKTIEEYAEELNNTLREIMEEMKDDEAQALLSSGVDSSYILAVSGAKVANTCGYADKRFDESQQAEETAKLFGAKLNRAEITPEEFFAEIPHFCENVEQPLGDASGIVYAIACRSIAERNVKTCYSGEGSDEFFGGYRMYQNAERYKEHLHEFYAGNTMIMKEEDKKELLLDYKEGMHPVTLLRDIYEKISDYDPLSKMLRIDISLWLEGDIYLNVDKMSDACGLEVLMPLTDVRIFDIASRIPPEYKVTDKESKLVLRMAANKVLPDEVAFRKKIGFVVPIRYWLADEKYNEDVRKKLFGESAAKFFRKETLEQIYNDYVQGNSDLWRKIWTIYIFLKWYEIYFCGEKVEG